MSLEDRKNSDELINYLLVEIMGMESSMSFIDFSSKTMNKSGLLFTIIIELIKGRLPCATQINKAKQINVIKTNNLLKTPKRGSPKKSQFSNKDLLGSTSKEFSIRKIREPLTPA